MMGACTSSPSEKHYKKTSHMQAPQAPPAHRQHSRQDSQGMDVPFVQKITVPSYFYPGCKDWNEVVKCASVVDIAIINPNSGPGKKVDPNYVAQTKAAQAAGIKILGYVHTSYGKRELPLIQDEIENFFNWYNVDGIFLDEIPTQRSFVQFYDRLNQQIKSHKGALTILNPGTHPNEAYFGVADIICNFEDGYHNYMSTYRTPDWMTQNNVPPEKVWHIVHSIPGPEQLGKVLELAKSRRAGHIFVTSERMPNPYGKLPETAFWQSKLKDLTPDANYTTL